MERRRQLRAAMVRQVVEAAIAAEEECKSVRISEPHFIPTHVSIPGSNVATSPSVSIRSPGLTVHCLSRRRSWPHFSVASCHVLASSAFSGHPLSMSRMPSLVSLLTAPAASSFTYVGHGSRGQDWEGYLPGPETPGPSPTESTTPHGRIRAALPPWLIARRHQWRERTMKPARKAISTPAGVRAHGAPLGVGNRYGGRDWVDCRPFYPGFP